MRTETTNHEITKRDWKPYELVLFRIAFVFFTLMSIPLSGKYYQMLFSINWLHPGYRDLTNLGRFSPSFFNIPTESGRWGLASYADYGVLLLIAFLGAAIWSLIDRKRTEYAVLYYWLRVLVRYRVAIGMIEFGFVKVFLIQMPQAPLGTLHTNFGDITAQKLYWLSVGVVPWYEIVLGLVEVIAGFLLFFRKTTFPGALLTAAASANIVYINFAYDGGVHVYSSYFVILCVFLMIPYLPDYYRLLVKGEDVIPIRFYPSFSTLPARISRYILKSGIMFLFLVVLAGLHVQNRLHNPLVKEPVTPGLPGTTGYYDVSLFSVDGRTIPYSPLDTLRWQDATFEKFSTITFKVNKPVKLDLSNGVPAPKDIDRTWELTGISGGRRYFHYEADTSARVLKLYNKHKTGKDFKGKISPSAQKPKPDYIFHYTLSGSTIVLNRTDEEGRSLHIELSRQNKRYALRK